VSKSFGFHEILSLKHIQNTKPVKPEGEGMVKEALGKRGDVWAMPDESWLDKETAEDREMFFVIVVLEEAE
jgi:hypothetical protein